MRISFSLALGWVNPVVFRQPAPPTPSKPSRPGVLVAAAGLHYGALAVATHGARVAMTPYLTSRAAARAKVRHYHAVTPNKAKLPPFTSWLYILLGKNGYPTHRPIDDFFVFPADAVEQLADASRQGTSLRARYPDRPERRGDRGRQFPDQRRT